jgi:hypothetical protein
MTARALLSAPLGRRPVLAIFAAMLLACLACLALAPASRADGGPVISGVSPDYGPVDGGTTVTITGSGFTDATAVNFDSNPAASFTVDSDTSITATSPAGAVGAADVTVVADSDTSTTSPADQFTYEPTVTGVSPAAGPVAGGNSVTITGSGFDSATNVSFGLLTASFVTISDTEIVAAVPAASAADTVDVTVGSSSLGTISATGPSDEYSYDQLPTVTGVSPNAGPTAGGTTVTITGTGFTSGATVDFGTTAAPATVTSTTSITASAPAGTGTQDITVTTPGGISAASTADQFTYDPAPSVTGVSPDAGPTAGGSSVTITGTGFTSDSTVDIGGTPVTPVTFNSTTSLTLTTPPGTGTQDITVTTPEGGMSATSISDEFTYGPPSVTSLSPNDGPLSGGTSVTISGAGFTLDSTVAFGMTPAESVTINSSTSITAVSPVGESTGATPVTVTTPGGTSPVSGSAQEFTYLSPPAVTGVSPSDGPLIGGTMVTITGSGFSGGLTAVDFGSTPAASYTYVNDSKIRAVAPPGSPGPVDVTVTTSDAGTSNTSPPADQFTYVPAPTVSAISTNAGPTGGGTSITISGTGFTAGATVAFGSTTLPTSAYTILSGTTITATAPSGSGVQDITVTTVGGTSTKSGADQFTYDPAPTIATVSPSAGPLVGGTTVTITGTNFFNNGSGLTVSFDGVPATSVTVLTPTTVTAVSPASPATGTVNVTASTAGGPAPASLQFTYDPVPTVTSVSPNSGRASGGNTVMIMGSGFTIDSTVAFNGTAATSVVFLGSGALQAASPPGSSGTVDVTVTTPGGTSASSPFDQFTYDGVPSVTSVSLDAGPLAGGATVRIDGTNFISGSTVQFGETAAASVTFNSATSITATSPAEAAGTVDITVTTPGGTSATSVADSFTYTNVPTVTNVTPTAGPLAGSAKGVTITGTSFAPGATVKFGTTAAPVTVLLTSTSISASVPATATAGTVDITVTDSIGGSSFTSSTSPADQYTYDPVPTVTGIGPSTGAPAGGTSVTISGTGFTGGSTVAFGSTVASSVTVNSATSITAVAPASGAGTDDITVTTPGGTSATSPADQFTYVAAAVAVTTPSSTPVSSTSAQSAAPAVSGIAPASGPIGGGTSVTINGGNFGGATAVMFGSTPAASFTIESASEIIAVAPSGAAGAVGVTVATPAGSSSAGTQATFIYAPSPTVIGVRVGSVGSARSTLTGTVDDGGVSITSCTFSYGRTSAYGKTAKCATPATAASGATSVSATVTGLSPATTYHYRLAVTTAAGSVKSADAHFVTHQLPALEAPYVGLVVQRQSGTGGQIGRLFGIQGIQDGVAGESIQISCIHACSRKTSLTLKNLKQPLKRVKATLAHALALSRSTRVEIRVSKAGELGRFAVYAFSPSGSQLSVKLVQTGCVSAAGKTVGCTAPRATSSERQGSRSAGAQAEVATDVVGVRLKPR